jgi:ABC-type multidrug transport system fused ATPase/permease subunit
MKKNKNKISSYLLIINLWKHLSKAEKFFFYKIIFLIISASFFEILTISSSLPLFSILTNSNLYLESKYLNFYFRILGASNYEEKIIFFIFTFLTIALFSGLLRLLLLNKTIKFSYEMGRYFGQKAYFNVLNQSYSDYCDRVSSDTISAIAVKTDYVISLVHQIINIITSSVFACLIIIALSIVSPFITVLTVIFFLSCYGLIIYFHKLQISKNSIRISSESANGIRLIQNALGSFRDILLDNSQKIHLRNFEVSNFSLREAQAINHFISVSPKIYIDTITIAFIGLVIYLLFLQNALNNNFLPIIGMFAFSSQRVIPLFQQIYSSIITINASNSSILDLLELLKFDNAKLPNSVNKKIKFNNSVSLNSIFFSYGINKPFILKNINLTLIKGEKIGIVGPSGSGKSTLIDIIIGFLNPTSGEVKIDDQLLEHKYLKDWKSKIAHVPQNIFLKNSNLIENIAFGISPKKINKKLVIKASKQAGIYQTILNMPNGFNTKVGEGGIKLSGGQKQRIAIARALYKKSEIIIFDEATSALDIETESRIMKTIYNLKKIFTVIIISHRISALSLCDRIVKINKNGSLLNR